MRQVGNTAIIKYTLSIVVLLNFKLDIHYYLAYVTILNTILESHTNIFQFLF